MFLQITLMSGSDIVWYMYLTNQNIKSVFIKMSFFSNLVEKSARHPVVFPYIQNENQACDILKYISISFFPGFGGWGGNITSNLQYNITSISLNIYLIKLHVRVI